MPDLGFKDQHVAAILAGDKPFTLRRAWKHGRTPDIGAKLGLVSGWRTPARRRFAWAICEFRCTVFFGEHHLAGATGWREVEIAGSWAAQVRELLPTHPPMAITVPTGYGVESGAFAKLDGFESYAEFWTFHSRHRAADAPAICERELIGLGCVTAELES